MDNKKSQLIKVIKKGSNLLQPKSFDIDDNKDEIYIVAYDGKALSYIMNVIGAFGVYLDFSAVTDETGKIVQYDIQIHDYVEFKDFHSM